MLCVQEARSATLPDRLGSLRLAVATARNRLGVALYVKAERLRVERAASFRLTTSRHDRLVGGTDERLAAARVHDLQAGRDLVLGSLALFVEPEPDKPLLLVSSYPFTKGAQ